MKQFRNQLSCYQKAQISKTTGLVDDELKLLIDNIEFQLNSEGYIPTNSDGDLDFSNSKSNVYAECRDHLGSIEKLVSQLRKEVEHFDAKSYRQLMVSSRALGLEPTSESDGDYKVYEDITVTNYLNELFAEVENVKRFYQPKVKAKSARITEGIYTAWCFSIFGELPNGKTLSVKVSDSNPFIEVVSIVTSWSIDTTKKNVSNANWYKLYRKDRIR
ncbi:hypothetical protein ACNO65_13920 [Vibrio campbellii]|uniref:hypothetical protein n=1 Tax=Vibrio campbellii TaxID=680 RepID=UPI00249A50F6|nr:hypothetical protein [Vibrio campbellii]